MSQFVKSLDTILLSDFAGRVGNTFRIWIDDNQSVSAELVETHSLGFNPLAGGKQAERESFSLQFRALDEWRYPQRIFRVDHNELGSLEFFLVPLGPDDKGMRLEAIFNFL
jgi:hypothetical protein